MAKIDANGRPIYETAEEYNRAHGTGTARRTYDSPEGENYKHTTYKQIRNYEKTAERQKKVSAPKSTKKVLIILAVGIIFVNMAVISLMFNAVRGTVGGFYETYEDDWADYEDEDGYGEYLGDSDTPLMEGFDTFTYNGVSYSIPMTYDEFSQMGFTLEEAYDEDTILAVDGYEHLIINGEDGYMVGIVRITNNTEEDLPIKDCVIDYFSIDNPAAYDSERERLDFVFGNGLSMESTYEELEAYLGVPYYQYIDDDEEYGCYESYEWLYNTGSEYQCVMISLWDGVITNVCIENSEY